MCVAGLYCILVPPFRLLTASVSLVLGRSPLAEAVFLEIVNRNGLRSKFGTIDSCGTGEMKFVRQHEIVVSMLTLSMLNQRRVPCR